MTIERRRVRCDVKHRRDFLVASAALGAALLLPSAAAAAEIKVLQGGVRVNGKRASRATRVRPGDMVETGQDARVAFVVGQDAFLLRGESKLILEQSASGKAVVVSGLRLLSGGLLAAFSPGPRRIETPTATAGIRGTAVYIEASTDETYFCTCYGVVELRDKAGLEKKVVISGYHTPNTIYANPAERGKMASAEVKDHTDEELIMLERLVGRTSPIVQRNQKLKEATQPEPSAAPKPTPEPQRSVPEDKPAEKGAPERAPATQDRSSPADTERKPVPDEDPATTQKPGKKTRAQKPKKAAPKPQPEAPTSQPAPPAPEPLPPELKELGPAPTPPAAPQPPAQEWRLPPPRLD